MSRGNHQESIFWDHRDRRIFLDTLGEACAKTGWLVHAFVLMNNHYHFLLETPYANLVVGMKWLQGTYTQRFNARHKLWGHLFQGRYKALPVEGENGDYFSVLCSYIHLNPARAKLFDLEKGQLSDFSWSSYLLYLEPAKRPDWLRVCRGLNASGLEDTVEGRNAYRQMMQKRVLEIACSDCPHEVDERWADLRRGWFCGGDTFRKKILNQLDGVIGGQVKRGSLSGEAVQLHDEAEAERLVSNALVLFKLDEKDLSTLPKGAEEKKAIVALIKEHTHVSNQWIVNRLSAGHAANISRYMADVRSAKSDSRLYKLSGMLKCED